MEPRKENSGVYKGFEWFITNGICRCAYIKIPKDNFLYNIDYDSATDLVDYIPHGCFTYAEKGPEELFGENDWILGWDYGHAEDFTSFNPRGTKVWTLEEIQEEVYKTIDAIINKEKK